MKWELFNSLEENDHVKEEGIANNATAIIHCYEEIIKTQNKKAIVYTGKQGKFLKKSEDTEKFFDDVSQSRLTIYFKISLFKFLKKYPLLKTSTLQSSCFKNSFQAIKAVCKENPTLFV